MSESNDQGSFFKAALIIAAIILVLATPVILFVLQEPISYLEYRAVNLEEGRRLEGAASWTQDFVARKQRLPTREEFKAFREHSLPGGELALYKRGELDIPDWGPFKDDFVVGGSTGEWNLYRRSWAKEIVYVYSE